MPFIQTRRFASMMCVCALYTSAGAQEPLFRQLPPERQLSDRQAALVESAKASGAAIGVQVMTADPRLLGGRAASTLALRLSARTSVTASRNNAEADAWRGAVDGTTGTVTLMQARNGSISGTVQHDGRYYAIRPMGDRLHAIVELDQEQMPPEHQPPLLLSRWERSGQSNGVFALGSTFESRAAPHSTHIGPVSSEVTIDVMVAYTRNAAGYYNDIRSDLIALAIAEANESFRISGLQHVKLRLVHAYQTAYVEEGSHFDHVWRLADRGDGVMEEVHTLRNEFRADVVILVVDDAQGCGLATRVHPDADEAFAVVHHECAATTLSLAHEIGHIIGTRHELDMDKNMTPFPYGHGYVNGTKWRDIMSYKESCGGCPRIPVWSSPIVRINGEPAGTPELDNARVISEQSARVAAFR
jgi:peptidyl-Asp metalloendopeptidase